MKRTALFIFAIVLLFSLSTAWAQEEEPWYDKLTISGWGDARILAYNKYIPEDSDFEDVSTSDVYVYEMGLTLEAEPVNYLTGRITLLYEQFPASPVDLSSKTDQFGVDEATLKFKIFWLYFQVGKFNLPFGLYTPIGVTDPFPKQLGDINQTAYEVGLDNEYFTASWTHFNGINDLDGETENIDDWVVRLAVRPIAFLPQERWYLELGGAYLNDFTETKFDATRYFFLDDQGELAPYKDTVGAFNAYLNTELHFIPNKFGVRAMYQMVASMTFDKDNYLNAQGDESNISAYDAEMAFIVYQYVWFGGRYDRLFGVDALNTLRYNTADPDSPDYEPVSMNRYGAFIGFGNPKSISTQVEYLRGVDNEDFVNDTVTLQLKMIY